MAIYSITTEGAEALAAATAETVLGVRGLTTVKAVILEWGVAFDGASATAVPVRVRLNRHSTDGTATAATEVPWDGAADAPAALLTGFHSYTAEPTTSATLVELYCHPQGGLSFQYGPGRGPTIGAATTSRLGIECVAPATVNVTGYLVWEE